MNKKSEYGKQGYISFDRLWMLLEKRGKNKQYLLNNGFSKVIIYKLVNNENVTCEIIARLCNVLKCSANSIMEYIPDTKE